MSYDLRDELVEAGMEALANTDPPMEPPEYGIDELSEACLNAFLGVLEEREREWDSLGLERFEDMATERRSFTYNLIQVLRESSNV